LQIIVKDRPTCSSCSWATTTKSNYCSEAVNIPELSVLSLIEGCKARNHFAWQKVLEFQTTATKEPEVREFISFVRFVVKVLFFLDYDYRGCCALSCSSSFCFRSILACSLESSLLTLFVAVESLGFLVVRQRAATALTTPIESAFRIS